jgi:hypothetical protein
MVRRMLALAGRYGCSEFRAMAIESFEVFTSVPWGLASPETPKVQHQPDRAIVR